MADPRDAIKRQLAESMGGSAAAKLYEAQETERQNRKRTRFLDASRDAAERAGRKDMLAEIAAERAAYNTVQNMREQDVESAAKDAGWTGDPYDPSAPFRAKVKNKYAKGGYVRSADGCAKRGKTKGRVV